MKARWFGLLLVVALAASLLFLTLPIATIFLDTSPGALIASLGDDQALEALRLSFYTSTIALALIVAFGTPAAYLLATRRFRGRAVLITLIELPLVVPPAVAGIALLSAFGPNGVVGGALEQAGVRLVFESAGVVVAMSFVAGPFYLRAAQTGFEAVNPSWIAAARTLGASEARAFAQIAIPAARAGLVTGAALCWGRAVGEFGATLVFAGSFRGTTQTASLAIVELFGNDFDAALALSAVLVALSAGLLVTIKLAARLPASRTAGR